MPVPVVLLLAALVAVAGYGLACRLWPYAACWRCGGDGKRRSPSGKAWRACRRCRGSGSRLRVGRRILNRMSSTAQRAAR